MLSRSLKVVHQQPKSLTCSTVPNAVSKKLYPARKITTASSHYLGWALNQYYLVEIIVGCYRLRRKIHLLSTQILYGRLDCNVVLMGSLWYHDVQSNAH